MDQPGKKMIEELVSRTFAARDVAHREHHRATSYAQHVTLNEFYEAIVNQIDEIVECYQGQFGLIGDYQVETSPVSNITTWLMAELDWINTNREGIANGNPSIGNLIDGLTGIYQRSIYKLAHLS
jgi:hypothetical protein